MNLNEITLSMENGWNIPQGLVTLNILASIQALAMAHPILKLLHVMAMAIPTSNDGAQCTEYIARECVLMTMPFLCMGSLQVLGTSFASLETCPTSPENLAHWKICIILSPTHAYRSVYVGTSLKAIICLLFIGTFYHKTKNGESLD